MEGFFAEFANDDVGPFASRSLAESYGRFEHGDEYQVFKGAEEFERVIVLWERPVRASQGVVFTWSSR